MTKLEEIARAVRESWGDWIAPSSVDVEMSLIVARAAVEALWEPSEGMMQSGDEAILEGLQRAANDRPDLPLPPKHPEHASHEVWQAMLTAILEEE